MGSKMGLIARREFSIRIRKKSFLILTLIAPVALAAITLLPSWLMLKGNQDHFVIGVYDQTGLYAPILTSDSQTQFVNMSGMPLDSAKNRFAEQGMTGLVFIRSERDTLASSSSVFTDNPVIVHYVIKQQGLEYENRVNKRIAQESKRRKLEALHLPNAQQVLKQLNTDPVSQTIIVSQGKEKEGSAVVSMGVAYVAGFAIYMAVLIFASMVMRGVIEEKSNRIVEIMVSSVRPFDLMMGKILGIAAVGLLQFTIWIGLGILAVTSLQSQLLPSAEVIQQGMQGMESMQGMKGIPQVQLALSAIADMNWPYLLGAFALFFAGGYLLYAAMFAMVGSAVDNEADTQQFALPVTAPMVVALIAMMQTFNSPDSAFAFWMSIIPFTSPVVMMARIPFGVPLWEVALSLGILYVSMIAIVFVASRVYRIGILMYGKKPSYKDLWIWFRFKG